MRSDGVPADAVSLVTYLFTTVLDGRNAGLADGVQRALGRDPTDFASYARRAAAAGAWNDSALATMLGGRRCRSGSLIARDDRTTSL